ncbi:MAG: sigma-54-dependent Fis family transcriptional regulator [Acidobacteria bacterium]|nr:MAG: sigma-54-dependent Fis family transcriptional regulator [Acidobacteriota bacterium]
MSAGQKTLLAVSGDAVVDRHVSAAATAGHRVLRAPSGESALLALDREEIEMMLVDVDLPGISGLELLRIVKENYPLVEVVMMARGDNDLEGAVQSIKDGAYNFVARDIDAGSLAGILRNAAQRQDLNRQVLALSAQVEDPDREFIVGPSQAMLDIVDVVRKVGRLPATILILGESGTGKELLARLVHRESADPSAPFIAVNLAAIPQELVESTLFGHEKGAFTGAHRQQLGKFELAGNGTLFLDEVGDLRLDLQAKLLRAIQEGEIERVGGSRPVRTSFRLIASTNTALEKAVKEGRFRDDLFYRLNVIPIRMPPLRDRIEDVPELAAFFLRRYNARFHKDVKGFSEAALELLKGYWWPGNIRELQNLVERLVAVSEKEWITDEDLPFDYHMPRMDTAREEGGNLLQEALDTFERNVILKSLEKSGWNVSATARYLGVPLSTLKHKMERLEVRALARRLRGG